MHVPGSEAVALDFAITAHAGHFTYSVRKNLAAVEKKK